MAKIISITGDLGSGKSTVSNLLCERLEYDYVYTGNIQRKIAKRYNMNTLELNKYSETHPEIDEEIDATVKSLNNSDNLIVDSRLAWFFIPKSFKIFLKADIEVSAKRISEDNKRKTENYSSEKEAISKIIARKESEHKRYTELYGIGSLDLSNFDLVIDTSFITPEEVANTIISEYNMWLQNVNSKPQNYV
jgi:cytidylate kinase